MQRSIGLRQRISVASWPTVPWWLYASLALNVISIFVLSLSAFRANAPYLFYGLDGRFEISIISQATLFTRPMLAFANDFIHGLGNVWFPVNPWLIPAYVLSLTAPGDFNNFPLAYAICATVLFVATYLTARIAACPRIAALAGAWLVVLVSFQFVGWNLIPTTSRAFPHYATVIGMTTMTSVALLHVGRFRLRISLLIAGLCFLAISHQVIATPTSVILAGPQYLVFGIVSIVAAKGRGQAVLTVTILGAMAAACLLLGYAHFLSGLVLFTAADVFKGLSLRSPGLTEVSMLFWNPLIPFFTIERTFVLFGLLGAVWAVIRCGGVLRLTAIAFLVVASLYLVTGIVHAYHRFWFGPALWYFEGFLFPYHAIFSMLLVLEVFRIARRLLERLCHTELPRNPALGFSATAIAIAVLPWVYIGHAMAGREQPTLPFYEPHPQAETAITKILKDEVALKPGQPFRGRVATLTGRIFPETTNVDMETLSVVPDILAMRVNGNTHSYAGLWQDSIPTLLEVNPLMTPPYFAFMRTFFTEPADKQMRTFVAMRRIDPRLLAAIGVRFIVTDRPYVGRARLWASLDIPVSPDQVRAIGVREPIADFTLYLYELENVNVGQYSPTTAVAANRASEMLALLGDPALDLAKTFVAAELIPEIGGLAPARLNDFIVERGHFTVRASSVGRSVLILPLEFSHCLRVRQHRDHASQVQLFRANLLTTAILFERELDATITYRTGPIINSTCRIRDSQDMTRIDMKNAFERRPDLAPVGN
jgi:hypothetical protein